MENQSLKLSVSEFLALTNQLLDTAYPVIEVEGEVANFKVNQGKFVFFDIKDSESSLGCFMMAFSLRIPIEDGMKVVIRGRPKLTKWGKFSFTVEQIRPVGEGSLRRAFELLKAKLEKEGLFGQERKRPLPEIPKHIAVISSTQAAGYEDFMKIIATRWGGMQVDVAHVQVQGASAPDQIIRALKSINEREHLPEVIVLIRGGGSRDDLMAFDDELLVRAIAASRVPVLVGIGHENDETLADLVADLRASTPSNAAEMLVPDRIDIARQARIKLHYILSQTSRSIEGIEASTTDRRRSMIDTIDEQYERIKSNMQRTTALIGAYNPRNVLERGYAIIRGNLRAGAQVEVETIDSYIDMEVKRVKAK